MIRRPDIVEVVRMIRGLGILTESLFSSVEVSNFDYIVTKIGGTGLKMKFNENTVVDTFPVICLLQNGPLETRVKIPDV